MARRRRRPTIAARIERVQQQTEAAFVRASEREQAIRDLETEIAGKRSRTKSASWRTRYTRQLAELDREQNRNTLRLQRHLQRLNRRLQALEKEDQRVRRLQAAAAAAREKRREEQARKARKGERIFYRVSLSYLEATKGRDQVYVDILVRGKNWEPLPLKTVKAAIIQRLRDEEPPAGVTIESVAWWHERTKTAGGRPTKTVLRTGGVKDLQAFEQVIRSGWQNLVIGEEKVNE